MQVDAALLCDWATVREGLLHILGGGITRVWRDTYPAPLGAALALRIIMHPTEVAAAHDFKVVLIAEDGEELANIEGQIEDNGEAPTTTPGESPGVNVALPMPTLGIPHAGGYSFEVLIDGVHQVSVPFRVEPRSDQ